ncbi:MAG: flagellar hook-basal body complex protein FliE [Magnetococcales bacterium]|nr:flagellar hook-basal body complex protein FliE [Magnetococcales bacterium]MBF0157805.1 flagellar hook-basal body complex protein FliE [Magnetococcales bacterium]
MAIEGIRGTLSSLGSAAKASGAKGGGGWEDFSTMLGEQIRETDRLNREAQELSEKALMGNMGVDIHEAQIAGSKAELHLRLLMQVRNKAVEVYREVMGMQA